MYTNMCVRKVGTLHNSAAQFLTEIMTGERDGDCVSVGVGVTDTGEAVTEGVRVAEAVIEGVVDAVVVTEGVNVGVCEQVDTNAVAPALQQAHAPEHADADKPVALPNVPAGQRVDALEPSGQNDPAGQVIGALLAVPAGQYEPALSERIGAQCTWDCEGSRESTGKARMGVLPRTHGHGKVETLQLQPMGKFVPRMLPSA
jgi:hypothetical protein